MRKFTFLLAFLFSWMGTSQVWAQAYECGFESSKGWASERNSSWIYSITACEDGWGLIANGKNLQISTTKHGGSTSLGTTTANTEGYVVSPYLAAGKVSFYGKRNDGSGSIAIYKVEETDGTFATVGEPIAKFTKAEMTGTSSWYELSVELDEDGRVAILLNYAYVDDFSAENGITTPTAAEGPKLVVKNGSTKIRSPYAFDFGLAVAGTTQTFTLSNTGTAALEGLSATETGNFGATLSATSIAAGEEATLTITMPDATSNSTITITSTSEGIEPFVINAKGTVRDASKLYVNDFSALPTDWTASGTWYYTANGAYTTTWYLNNNYRLITPLLDIAEGETFFVEAKGHSTSNTSYQHLQMQYSADGTTWTNFDAEPALDPSEWKTFSFTGVPVGKYYIAINACQADVRMFYGGNLPVEPKLTVTQPASLGYGIISEPTAKTFTIANTGRAPLEGITVTSSNSAVFAITGAPTSLAAGESQEVTITMSTATEGAQQSTITVSATGMDDVVFTVTGVVMPEGAFVIDFNDNALPAGWTATSWSFANGYAQTTGYNAVYMTTPKLTFATTNYFVFNVKASDSGSGDYVTVEGSKDAGNTWSELATFAYNNGDFGNSEADFTTVVVSGIPSTVNMIRFKGYYVRIDDITGLAYAPILSVTKADEAVTSPAAHDFGECGTNASVTYTFANAGAGTINITGVAITGEGAAAYSTNWTESVAAPFDLVITRAYDAARGGAAQEATVTVTTTEGTFVINVTGTDLAADLPAMSVTLDDAAVATGAACDFGTKLKAAPAAKTYTITNTGTGTLTGTIATSDETQFTVSETTFSLAAGESKTFDVALVFDTHYGNKAATITIHPTVAGLEDIVINATAQTIDPEAWMEDFEAGTLPNGWEATTWTIGSFASYDNTSKMALAPQSSTAGTIITPCLTAKTGDVLTWDAYFNWSDEAMTVEYSTDKTTWTKIYDAYKAETDFGTTRYTHKEMQFTAPADGDYYLRFTSTYQNGVDNFCGFKLNLPDHMMTITATNIPSSLVSSPTMKIGQSFDATITVKESRGVDEAFTAKLFMGDEVIGTANGTVEAGASKTITITATPTTFGTKMMHFEVEYAGGTLTTANVSRTVADLSRLTLDETSAAETLEEGTFDEVTLRLTLAAGYNTVCLPQAIDNVEAFFGAGAKAYDFDSYADGTLHFKETATMAASYPYIVKLPAAITEDILLNGLTIDYSNKTPGAYHKGTAPNIAYFKGTYAPVAAGEMTGNWSMDDKAELTKCTAASTINGFRAYFTLPDEATAAQLSFTDEDGTTTTINALQLHSTIEGAFNLRGQKVERLQKGLYIVNGKVVVKK